MKWLQSIVFFANTKKLDRLSGNVADGQRGATACVTIHFGQNHSGQAELLVKFIGGVHRILSSHRVGDEQDFLRIEQLLQELHLIH